MLWHKNSHGQDQSLSPFTLPTSCKHVVYDREKRSRYSRVLFKCTYILEQMVVTKYELKLLVMCQVLKVVHAFKPTISFS